MLDNFQKTFTELTSIIDTVNTTNYLNAQLKSLQIQLGSGCI
jgi:hypothetical protein